MTMTIGRNLSGPLERMTIAYRGRAVPDPSADSPVNMAAAVGDDDHLAAFVSLSLDEPAAVQRLHDAVGELRGAAHLADVLSRAVGGAMSLMDTELGNVQLVNPDDGSLVLVTQFGFGAEFLDDFAVVDDQYSVCGRAARQGAQAVVADVRADPAFAAHQGVFRAAGVRAVQSTPLVDGTGQFFGMISTHTPWPGPPADRDLWIMRLYSQLAGEAIARHLGRTSPDGDPARRRHETVGPVSTGREPYESPSGRLMSDTINRLFSVGLSLARAQRLITDALAAQRVRAGLDTLDETIRAIQLAMFDLGFDHHHRDGRTPQAVEHHSGMTSHSSLHDRSTLS